VVVELPCERRKAPATPSSLRAIFDVAGVLILFDDGLCSNKGYARLFPGFKAILVFV
jgi:hypothetical protein